MTRPLCFLALLLCTCPLSANGPKSPKGPKADKLEPYESVAGKFRVLLPGNPEETRTLLATAVGPVRVTTIRGAVHRELMLSVSFADYPDAFVRASPERIYDSIRDKLKGLDGRIEQEQDLESGREFRVVAGRNRIRCRVLLIGSRLYQIMATGTAEAVQGPTIATFFDSFQILK